MDAKWPIPKQQKDARSQLGRVFDSSPNTWVIHYACEDLYNCIGKSPRVTAIAMCNLSTEESFSFSLHHTAESMGIIKDSIAENYDEIEQQMLHKFFMWLQNHEDAFYLHWNMKSATYGFQAIEHRYLTLTQEKKQPYQVRHIQKTDLARLLQDIYGPEYIENPRFNNILEKNNCIPQGFIKGEDEPLAFQDGRLLDIHNSTVDKARVIRHIATLARYQRLKTNTKWWQMQGGHAFALARWVIDHPVWGALGVLIGLMGIIIPTCL